jgi:hypothetical protein
MVDDQRAMRDVEATIGEGEVPRITLDHLDPAVPSGQPARDAKDLRVGVDGDGPPAGTREGDRHVAPARPDVEDGPLACAAEQRTNGADAGRRAAGQAVEPREIREVLLDLACREVAGVEQLNGIGSRAPRQEALQPVQHAAAGIGLTWSVTVAE